jgi:hypothetical protein
MREHSYFLNKKADEKGCVAFRKDGGSSIDRGARPARAGIGAGDTARASSSGPAGLHGRTCEIGMFYRFKRRAANEDRPADLVCRFAPGFSEKALNATNDTRFR